MTSPKVGNVPLPHDTSRFRKVVKALDSRHDPARDQFCVHGRVLSDESPN
jgi:hypothetical protein